MITAHDLEIDPLAPRPSAPQPSKQPHLSYRLLKRFFARTPVREAVSTRVHFNASPEAVWRHIMLYEEVPARPPFLLRALLPRPIRTEGDKTRVGAAVRCIYSAGELVKRITAVEPPHLLQFEVITQHLGIEGCILTLGGSYQITSCAEATDVKLTTNYLAFLRPRPFWRPLEALLIHQLHLHILRGVCAAVVAGNSGLRPAFADSVAPRCAPLGGFACTASPSHSRR